MFLHKRPNLSAGLEFIALGTVHWMKRGGQSYQVITLPWCTVVSQRSGCSPALPYPLTGTFILAYRCKCRLRRVPVEQVSHLRDEIKASFHAELWHRQLIDHG